MTHHLKRLAELGKKPSTRERYVRANTASVKEIKVRLTEADKALLAHAKACAQCTEQFVVNMCDEGRRLYAALDGGAI
jgi:recombinational DNA repair protein RecR